MFSSSSFLFCSALYPGPVRPFNMADLTLVNTARARQRRSKLHVALALAGFLALSEKSAFPTLSVSGFVGLSIMEITVAGTAQDSHLIPFSCTGETPSTSPNRLQNYIISSKMQRKTMFFLKKASCEVQGVEKRDSGGVPRSRFCELTGEWSIGPAWPCRC